MRPDRIDERSLDLLDYLKGLRRRLAMILLVGFLTAAVSFGVSLLLPEIYRAEARVLVQPPEGTQAVASIGQEVNVETEKQLVLSRSVLEPVRREVAPSLTYESLLDHVEVTPPPQTELLYISASARSSEVAADLANEVATQYLVARAQRVRQQLATFKANLQNRLESAEDQLDQIEQQLQLVREQNRTGSLSRLALFDARSLFQQRNKVGMHILNLSDQLAELQTTATVPVDVGAVVQQATVPDQPHSPMPVRNALFGLVAGLITGVAFALGRTATDSQEAVPEQGLRDDAPSDPPEASK